MSDLTRETFPTPADRRPPVPVESPMGGLYVRRLSAGEAVALPDDREPFLAALLIQSVVFADGSQVWASDAEAMAYPMADLKPLVIAALDVNGLSKTSVEDKKGN